MPHGSEVNHYHGSEVNCLDGPIKLTMMTSHDC